MCENSYKAIYFLWNFKYKQQKWTVSLRIWNIKKVYLHYLHSVNYFPFSKLWMQTELFKCNKNW